MDLPKDLRVRKAGGGRQVCGYQFVQKETSLKGKKTGRLIHKAVVCLVKMEIWSKISISILQEGSALAVKLSKKSVMKSVVWC